MLKICGVGVGWMDAGRWWDGNFYENRGTWRKTCPLATFSNKFHTDWTSIDPDPPWWRASDCMAQPATHSYLCWYFITYSIEESHWGAHRFSSIQEIPSLLWIPKFHYHIHKRLPPVPILPSYLYYMNVIDCYAQSGICRERWKLRTYSLVCPAFTGSPVQGSLCTNTKNVLDERKQILCFLY